jgi:hypothetical protein
MQAALGDFLRRGPWVVLVSGHLLLWVELSAPPPYKLVGGRILGAAKLLPMLPGDDVVIHCTRVVGANGDQPRFHQLPFNVPRS